MSNQFEPKQLSIGELLTNIDSLYQVLSYQRPYKWGAEEVEQMWDDIEDAYKSYRQDSEPYFLGAMVTAQSKKSRYKDVVDGQQRLTTLVILCCVVRDTYPNINKDSDDELAVTVREIENAVFSRGGDGNPRLKFQQHANAQTDFSVHITNKKATCNLERPSRKDLAADAPKHKFINAAVVLRERLESIGEKCAAELLNFLFQNVKVVRIDCATAGAAIRIFQVINTRGMDLTPAELIKSYLLGKLRPESAGDDGEERQFISDWGRMEDNIKECDDMKGADELLALYAYVVCETTPKKGLYEDLRQKFKGKDPCEIAGKLKEFSRLYKEEIYRRKDKVVYALRYLPWSMLWQSILLAALTVDYTDYALLARALRRFYYLYWIAGRTLSSVKPISFDVIKKVKGKVSFCEIEEMLNAKIANDGVISQAMESLESDFIATPKATAAWCKPLLLMMEYDSTDDSKLGYIEMDKNLHLEHVLPDRYKPEEWKYISGKAADVYRYSGGNLTLLSGPKNRDASNKPFSEKINSYEGKRKQKGMTAFQITRDIVSDFQRGRYQKQWNEEAMRARKEWFVAQAVRILEIKIDSDSD